MIVYLIAFPAAIAIDVPFSHCPSAECGRKLVYKPPVRAVLYTISHGALPVLCTSLYCNGKHILGLWELIEMIYVGIACKTRFYNNYSVSHAQREDSVR